MTVSVFVGTSVDGFIARANGQFDFLPPDGGEPHGYNEFMASVDALVIGRKTFRGRPTLKGCLNKRLKDVPNLMPALAHRTAEEVRVLGAEDRVIRIVVQLAKVRSPPEEHGKAIGE